MTVERRDSPRDYQQRGLWLGVAAALVIALGAGTPGFALYGGQTLQVWLYVASRVALALSLVLCVLLVVPDLRARLGNRFRSEPTVFGWAFALLVVALLISIISGIEGAIDSLDEDTPFG
jgi:hypothetical protein